MSIPAAPPPQASAVPPKDWMDFFLGAIPSFKTALRVLRSPDPLTTAAQEKHAWLGFYTALLLLMATAMGVIIAADMAPYLNPWNALWTAKFAFFIVPSYDWPVLISCALCVLGALAIAVLASWLVGMQLGDGSTVPKDQVRNLAGYAAMGAAGTYALSLFLVSATGWMLSAFGIQVFIFNWLGLAAIAAIVFTTWQIRTLFLRTSLPKKSGWWLPVTISTTTILTCTLGAIFVMNCLTEGFATYGRTVNRARAAPTAAMVQNCAKISTDIVCAITVFPKKWQDYELIGDWRLGTRTSGDKFQSHSSWHPAKETDRAFALIKIASNQDITVEIRIATSIVCKPGGSHLADSDQFFAVQGRVLGETHNAPQKMYILINNANTGFAASLKNACLSQVVT